MRDKTERPEAVTAGTVKLLELMSKEFIGVLKNYLTTLSYIMKSRGTIHMEMEQHQKNIKNTK